MMQLMAFLEGSEAIALLFGINASTGLSLLALTKVLMIYDLNYHGEWYGKKNLIACYEKENLTVVNFDFRF
ncbi:hypothetical protein L1987_61198 [Smallanthus sonchifolius]|uniref:Uncharacterized protein n=1 Tax=Smallanthus sonchifolius TaxID=185202 RepID=A0ACB9DAJ4_9ASTR|nr:hypothetical protein L1987_61198 [Smallanthus sonchifolius]